MYIKMEMNFISPQLILIDCVPLLVCRAAMRFGTPTTLRAMLLVS
jgi:hypothetical protein